MLSFNCAISSGVFALRLRDNYISETGLITVNSLKKRRARVSLPPPRPSPGFSTRVPRDRPFASRQRGRGSRLGTALGRSLPVLAPRGDAPWVCAGWQPEPAVESSVLGRTGRGRCCGCCVSAQPAQPCAPCSDEEGRFPAAKRGRSLKFSKPHHTRSRSSIVRASG